ncbi:MAG: hypothetical protein KDD41_13390 [Flavobacteriales bacterium]|nr:hypothetical protein [Flavobacteriales bacterium]
MTVFNSHNADNIEIRPRFKLISVRSNEEVLDKIEEALPKQKEVLGQRSKNHIFLRIPEKKQHYWSPFMEVVVDKYYDNEEMAYIRCILGPKQSIWVMLVFFYIFIGVLALFGGMYGLVKWNLGKETIFIWAFPVAFVLFGIIYGTAKYGQRKGRDQMLYLVSFLYHAIDDEKMERL